MLPVVCRKVLRSLRKRGVAQTVLLAYRYALTFRPSARRALRAREEADREFDARYSVDTGGIIPLEALSIASASQLYGVRYEPVEAAAFRELMRLCGEMSGRTFIDFGAGKGRALLLASEYPFRRIVGVEFAPQLVAACRRNLISYRNPARVCHAIEVHEGDAADFALPAGPLVLFFYNPFDAAIMAKVVENVRRSLQIEPRPLTVIYHTATHEALWAAIPSLVRQQSPPQTAIFRTSISA